MEDELNDSSGIYWIDFEELDINNFTPLILKLKQELSNDKTALQKVVYKKTYPWKNMDKFSGCWQIGQQPVF